MKISTDGGTGMTDKPTYDKLELRIAALEKETGRNREAEEALRKSEGDYRTLVENISAGIYRNTGGPQGRFIKANPAIAKMFGYASVEEFMKVSVSDLYMDSGERALFVEELRRNGIVKARELLLKKKDGTPMWASCTATMKYDNENVAWIDGIIEDITARREAEEALRKSESDYRTLVQNLRAGVYRNTGGPQGRFIKANPAIAKMFGYASVEEFMKVSVSDLYMDSEERSLFVEELRRNGIVKARELRLKKKDGTPMWASCTATMKYDNGNIAWIDGIIEDITTRREAEEALRKSESDYRTLVQNLSAGVYRNTGSSQGRFIKANPAIVKMFGYASVEEFMKVSVSDLYMDSEERSLFVEELRRNGIVKARELRLKKKDGTPMWASCTATMKFDNGNIAWIDGIIEDITARKEAEEALRRSNEILNNILSASPVGIGLVEDNIISWANDRMAQMFGFSSEKDYVGSPLEIIYISKEEYNRVVDTLMDRLRTGQPPEVDAMYKRTNGDTFPGHFKMSCPDPSNPAKRAIFTIHDISWRKQAEEERMMREKLQGVLEMAGAICHEMNQPIQSVSAYSENLIEDFTEDMPAYERVKKIIDLTKKMGMITSKLQRITKYETMNYVEGVRIIDIDKSSTDMG